jgi:O-antigen/teichoic acid export membrane protein
VELGLGTVIIQFASHEWSNLSLDKYGYIKGDNNALSRLASLAKISLKWYSVGAIIVFLGLSIGGYIFFSRSPDCGILWEYPWFTLCFLTGVNICLVPLWSLLEGCNQVSNVYAYRLIQGVVSSLSIWVAILLGAGLWTASVSSITIFICALFFISYKYRNFFKILLFSNIQGSRVEWFKDIFPMQWRIAVSWISGYFSFSLFTPVLFKYYGPVVAGQMGMTWSLTAVIGAIGTLWVAPKVPLFGMFIAKKEYIKLDTLFWRLTKIVFFVSVIFSSFIWTVIYILNLFNFKIAERLLSPLQFSIFLVGQIILTISIPASSYLRAHKKEPLLYLSLAYGMLIATSILVLGKFYSIIGIALGYLLINLIITPLVFVVWSKCKKEWHFCNECLS